MSRRATPLLLALLTVIATLHSCAAFRIAPTFTFDYAKEPEQRWVGAVGTVLKSHTWGESFGPLVDFYQSTLVAKLTPLQIDRLGGVLAKRFPTFLTELHGVASDFAANGHPEVNMTFLTSFVFFHELAHAADLRQFSQPHFGRECTGVLMLPSDPAAAVIHARNLDQEVADARNVTLSIDFVNSTSGGKTLFQAVDFYWMTTGFVTGQKLGYLTAEENWRSADEHPPQSLEAIISRLEDPASMPQVFMFRHLFEQVLTLPLAPNSPLAFTRAVDFLNSTLFGAPFYAIISGPGRQGAVLSVSFFNSFNRVAFLGHDGGADSWFLVQTNYDRWLPDPSDDNRRTYAEHALRRLGRDEGATRLGGWQVISEPPVKNSGTFYSVLMSIDAPTRGFIRQPVHPLRYWAP